ncbi:hypothetical protein NUG13_12040 [Bacillus subtilis]|uniref:Uncharacterized protein n=1 Tax=Bacillus phage vB_BsuS_PJN02 TaxID=2920374 RepID=A0AC61TS11_9CAUD|nr:MULTISPECIES: hypothetical protein [Bacillus subtilis group]YP_010681754.1 hypothetical protein PQE76_gp136 [Bacillus phage vB_BsuS_PJN02]MCR4362059.1 hypothetical protein [Bacillus subtilis]UNH58479.1 hypothetical protein [Bacillus phage vB_BsuS_PJN02]UQB84327.1 hypothetical protein KMZ31_19590 [Bacillus amyloliquefaciens]WOF32962.1 hypothetical protein OEJ84_22825 [Bacillus subtilis]
MNLGEKIQCIINDLEDGDNVKIYFTDNTDNHRTVKSYISDGDVRCMESYLSNYKEYGFIKDCTPEGEWFEYVDFELIKGDEDI